MNVSLCMIVKDSASTIDRCLRSIVPFVDEVSVIDTGSSDDTEAIIRATCDDLQVPLVWGTWDDPEEHPEQGWISNFSVARQMSVDQSTGDVWCWIDADTRMVNGREWRDELDAFFGGHRGQDNPGLMLIPYDYEKDAHGRTTRVVVAQQACKRGLYVWDYPVHELPVATVSSASIHKALDKSFRFDHFKPASQFSDALDRNLWILEKHQADGKPMTARLWQNLGATQLSLGQYNDAIVSLKASIEMDPMGMESYASLLSLALCYRNIGNGNEALTQFLLATRRFPERKTPYIYLAETASEMGEYDKALYWLSIADKLPDNDGSTVYNPVWIKYGTMQIRARCLRELGMLEPALELYHELSAAFPENTALAKYVNDMMDEMDRGRLYKAYRIVADGCDPQIAAELWKHCPESIQDYPEPVRVRRPVPPENQPRAVIYCPHARQNWGPKSLETGVGGSEEAVILMSRHLVAQGFYVEVYGHPPREDFGCDDHGVVWLPQYAWMDEAVDVFIAWRSPKVVRLAPSARLHVVWCHDVIDTDWFEDDLVEKVDVVFCLSQFHAKPLAKLPKWADKVVITKNGMDPAYFVDGVPRRMNSFAYYSSMDRGVDLVLQVWPRILAEIPDAKLDIFYGFTPVYLDMMQGKPYLKNLKDLIDRLVEENKDTVTWRGMVGQKELAESMASTEFWLYPTSWPETSCITAMKCQAMGCIPITSRFQDSGVPETTQFDLGPPGRPGAIQDDPQWIDEWVEAVIAAAKKDPAEHDDFRDQMSRWARKTYSWDAIASDWALLFRTLLAKKAPAEVSA